MFPSADAALHYFAVTRADSPSGGVAVPSQKRYVYYFDQILKREVYPLVSDVLV